MLTRSGYMVDVDGVGLHGDWIKTNGAATWWTLTAKRLHGEWMVHSRDYLPVRLSPRWIHSLSLTFATISPMLFTWISALLAKVIRISFCVTQLMLMSEASGFEGR